ncbi:MAG: cytochrome c [Acidobacteriota bacterium]|nr:cytochrome c [Blastocatellia bacterium]MDW8413012.1 cytochrome c [Acidobacteriota bacterium]
MGSRWVVLLILAASCIGCSSLVKAHREPPLQIIPDMDDQPKYKPQAAGPFFGDGRASRPVVAGTVVYGLESGRYVSGNYAFYAGIDIERSETFYTGKEGDKYTGKNPLPLTEAVLKRGQERYNVTCANCHDRVGTGQGMVVLRGHPPATNLHDDRIRNMPDGQIFNTITNGLRNMMPLGHQISPEDRWAIIRYIRALQRSQNATLADVPDEQKGSLRK